MKKKAQDLKPGDVVIAPEARLVVTQADADGFVWVARSGEPYAPLANVRFHEDVEVESPALTPAQQHAEEAVKLVRGLAGVLKYRHTMTDAAFEEHRAASVEQVHEFLAKIDPPKPPSVEELAEALQILYRCDQAGAHLYREYEENIKSLLTRAHATGILKEAQ